MSRASISTTLQDTRTASRMLLPQFVCRVSGRPASTLETLRIPHAEAVLLKLDRLDQHLQEAKSTLSDVLYTCIGAAEQRTLRNKLLQLRRDVYNLRSIDVARLDSLSQMIPTSVLEACVSFAHLQQQRQESYAKAEKIFKSEIAAIRRKFQALIQHPDFQQGLLLSSRSLYASLPSYINRKPHAFRRKDVKVELGLLRYYTRAAMKATPFGTFCRILPGRIEDKNCNGTLTGVILHGDPEDRKSVLRLNKSLYGILIRHLKTRPLVRKHLPVELNPTLHEEKGHLHFLASIENREVFQRIGHNPVLALIKTALRQQDGLPLGDFIDMLQRHPGVEASQDEASQYLDKLIDLGLLRFRTGISEQEVDWDLPLCELLRPIDDEHTQLCVAMLEQVRDGIATYAQASVDKRAILLDEVTTQIQTALGSIGGMATLPLRTPFYEDTTASATAHITASTIAPIRAPLLDFIELTMPLAWPRTEQATMRHFYDTYYGKRTEPLSLLQFYENYYREHYKNHLEKQRKLRAQIRDEETEKYNALNPFNLEVIQHIQNAFTNLKNLIADRWEKNLDADEIDVSRNDLEYALKEVPPVPQQARSVSIFAQIVVGQSTSPHLIVPNGTYLMGYGKYFSRFLYLFPDTLQQHLYAFNQTLTDQYVAEICGDANFNGNLHPPLLPWEISYPTGESGSADVQLPSATLYVKPDANNPYALCLQHAPSGKQVVPVDLGFLNPKMRPPLYQLLSSFSSPANFTFPFPSTPYTAEDTAQANEQMAHATLADEALPKTSDGADPAQTIPPDPPQHTPHIWYRPRITYEKVLVFARKSWRVPAALFPATQPDESPFAYFVRVNRWRHQHGIPSEVYVRIQPLPQRGKAAARQPEATTPAEPDPQTSKEELSPPEELYTPDDQPLETEAELDGQDAPLPGAKRHRYTRGSRDYRKPQYIDFCNPLLVGLFGKMTVNLKQFIVTLEERYPEADALPVCQDRTYSTELVLQLNFPDQNVHQGSHCQSEHDSYVTA